MDTDMALKWLDPEPVTVPRPLREAVGGHPLVAETLVRRGITTPTEASRFLDPQAYESADPLEMPGLAEAADRLQRALNLGERICVWGDFDVDGQTATTVLVSALRALGGDVIYHIPVRATESHGMRLPWFAEVLEQGVRLVVTCDTGVDAHEAVAYANSHGVDVVITDHHELPDDLPDAHAIVNPHLLPAVHPLATLPGVGVAYKVAEALYARSGGRSGADRFLDLVALGIVADVAVQTGDTRYLLQRGLEGLRQTPRLGLQELMKIAKIAPAALTEEDIGFGLGPRLNALGRLGDANPIVELLTTEDLGRARILASQLESLNNRRKSLCDHVLAGAEAKLARQPALLDDAALVLEDPKWPAGVIGIVANRLVERYQKPAVLLTAPPGEMARGSARSVEGCHITEAIATQADLLEAFGGHAMAAGIALDPEDIDAFRRGLSQAVAAQLAEITVEPALAVHGYVSLGELSVELVNDLRRLAPFGPGNPALVLATPHISVANTRQLGSTGRHLKVTVEDQDGTRRNVLWWNWDGEPLPEGTFDVAFTVGLNHFRGQTDVQLVWQAARQAATKEAAAAEVEVREQTVALLDFRRMPEPWSAIAPLVAGDGDVQIWFEGEASDAIAGRHRLALEPAETLVIWRAPPGPRVLRAALKRAAPGRVAVVAQRNELDHPPAFLAHLMGLVKYALNQREGWVRFPELAAVMGQREAAIKAGLSYLEARGAMSVVSEGETVVQLSEGGERDSRAMVVAQERLIQILEDTAAYRRTFAAMTEAQLLDGLRSDRG
jgi:single-stranded-DNA-specific exonuclease